MKRLALPLSLVLALTASSGCLFHRKSAKPKENPHIATEMALGFKERWLQKREAELAAQGVAADAAAAQAAKEFADRYEYLQSGSGK